MLRIFAVLAVVLLAVVGPAGAQVVFDDGAAWFNGAACPANWATFTPPKFAGGTSLTSTASDGRPERADALDTRGG